MKTLCQPVVKAKTGFSFSPVILAGAGIQSPDYAPTRSWQQIFGGWSAACPSASPSAQPSLHTGLWIPVATRMTGWGSRILTAARITADNGKALKVKMSWNAEVMEDGEIRRSPGNRTGSSTTCGSSGSDWPENGRASNRGGPAWRRCLKDRRGHQGPITGAWVKGNPTRRASRSPGWSGQSDRSHPDSRPPD